MLEVEEGLLLLLHLSDFAELLLRKLLLLLNKVAEMLTASDVSAWESVLLLSLVKKLLFGVIELLDFLVDGGELFVHGLL